MFLKKKSVFRFFLLIYILSLPFWLIELFIEKTNLPLSIPITDIFAAFTPLFAACILTYKEEGSTGIKTLLFRIFDYKKLKIKWWIMVLLLPILIFMSVFTLLKFNHFRIADELSIQYISIPVLFLFFFLGAVGEEVGYTGYAAELLQKKYSAFSTGLIIGIPWIIWHFPSMLQQGRDLNFFIWGSLGTIAFRVIYIWLYNNTQQSLFACILMHCLYNSGRVIFPSDDKSNPLVQYPNFHYGVIIAFAVLITILWGPKTLKNFSFKRIKKHIP